MSRTRWPHWRKHWDAWKIPFRVGIWLHSLSLPVDLVAMAFSIAGAEMLQQMWEGLHWEGVWLDKDPWAVVRLRTSSCFWNIPRKYEPHGEVFFLLIKKEPFALTEAVQFKPCFVPAETLKACALTGPHLMAAGVDSGTSSS